MKSIHGIHKIYDFAAAGKRSGSSSTNDDAVVTEAADDGTDSDSPTPVAKPNTAAAAFRLPNQATFNEDEKVVPVCKYLLRTYFIHL